MLCAPMTSQVAAIEALENGAKSVEKMKNAYHQRRDYMVRRLQQMGIDCHSPGGAFYVFPDIRKFGLTSKQFAMRLLEETCVAAVPGDAFGASGEGFLRCCYATGMDQIVEAMNRIEKFIKSL